MRHQGWRPDRSGEMPRSLRIDNLVVAVQVGRATNALDAYPRLRVYLTSLSRMTYVHFEMQKHQWSSGRIHRCHRCDPGSIPG